MSTTDISHNQGVVLMLPGIEGNAWQLGGTVQGLKASGLTQDVEIIPWGSGLFGSVQNLTGLKANKIRAQHIADRVVQLRKEGAERAITLIGFSGGGGLAILALEALPPDVQPDRVILISAAISNNYDLSPLLPRCKQQLVNYYSPFDGIVGWGTSLFGTIDRKHTISAGHSGFVDSQGKLRSDDKLLQVSWDPAWKKYGHFGGHIDWLSQDWAREVLAPRIDPALDKSTLTKL